MDSKIVSVSFLVLIMAVYVQSSELSRDHYPNPQEDTDECGRGTKRSFLCDPDRLLNPGEADQLDREIERVMNETDCPCASASCNKRKYFKGYKIGIALIKKMPDDADIPFMEGDSELDHALDKARIYAYTLQLRWKLGNCEEDIIIFYSKEDRVLYTMTGKTTKKVLNSGLVGKISMQSEGRFGKNTFVGLLEIINNYREILSGNYKEQQAVAKPQIGALTDSAASTSTSFIILTGILAAIFTF